MLNRRRTNIKSLSYQDGYEDGWDRRALNGGKLRSNSRQFRNQSYKLGFQAGWHDGEGRGVSWTTFNRGLPGSYPTAPKSWEQYEKEADKVAL